MNSIDVERVLARIFLITISFALTFLAIEGLARLYLWQVASEAEFRELASINQIKDRYGDDVFLQSRDRRDDHSIAFSPHHYLGYIPTPNYQHGENRHNALGFRGAEIPVEKSENTYRIVAVGGSTTYSVDVMDYRDSYPHLLNEYLYEHGYDHVEVINAGVSAYTSYHNLMNIEFRVLPLEPDLIIIYQGVNDINIRLVHPPSRYLGDNSGAQAPFVSDTVMPSIWEYSTALRILGIQAGFTRSHAALDWRVLNRAASNYDIPFRQQLAWGTYPSGIFQEASAEDMLENNPPVHFERNLVNMLAVAERHDVDVLLVTMVFSDEVATGNLARKEYASAMAEHNNVTRRIAKATGTALFDLVGFFPDNPVVY